MRQIEKRLQELERLSKMRQKSGLWIECLDNHVRIDSGARRGKDRTFTTLYDAVSFIEETIDNHDVVCGSLVYNDIFQLYRDSEGLRSSIEEIMPPDDLIKRSGVAIGNLKTSYRADVKLLSVLRPVLWNFRTVGFYNRWCSGNFEETDKQLVAACFELFRWERDVDPKEARNIFAGLFYTVTGLGSAKIASDYLSESEVI